MRSLFLILFLVSQLVHAADEASIRTALTQKLSFEVKEISLEDIVRFIGDKLNLVTWLDKKQLEEASVSPHTPITVKADNLPASRVLSNIVKDLELAYNVRHGVLFITTDIKAEEFVVPRLYTHAFPSEGAAAAAFRVIASEGWAEAGGTGEYFFLSDKTVLVNQTPEIHQLILDSKDFSLIQAPPARQTPDKIESTLSQAYKSEGQFTEMSLNDVTEMFRDRLKINIRLETKALEEASISADTPLSLDLPEDLKSTVTYDNVLHLLLEPLGVTFYSDGDQLVITTLERELAVGIVRQYKVENVDRKKAMAAILFLTPDEWEIGGGLGTIGDGAAENTIVVKQSPSIHKLIADLVRVMDTKTP